MKYKIKDIYNYTYRLTIKYENKKIIGHLYAFNEDTLKEKESSFELIPVIKNLNINKYDENVFIKQNFESIFGIDIKLANNEPYLFFLERIKNTIKLNPHYSFNDIEEIARNFNIQLDCEFKENKTCIYNCKSLSEIVFAILHYLIDNNYKINVCKYCDRFFITDTFKIPFCKDACPFPDKYVGKDCQYVKEQRMHSLSSKRRRIDKNLEYKYSGEDILYDFRDKCEEYKDKIKKSPSVWNINNYSEFLDKVDKYKYK